MIGILIGALAGYYGSWVDSIIMRFVDTMLCFPTFFLIIALIALFEPSIWIIMIVIGATNWMGVARLVRAEILSLKQREFILAARAAGASDFRIIFNHILPNSLAPVHVYATLGVASAILIESSLSFLGIGAASHAQLGQHSYHWQGQYRNCLVAFIISRYSNSDNRFRL